MARYSSANPLGDRPPVLSDALVVTPAHRARFRALVQSPLRAGLLRHLHNAPCKTFDLDSLMQAFGRVRLDVDLCMRELAANGYAEVAPGTDRYRAKRPMELGLARLLDDFNAGDADLSLEDQSDSVRRFRELIGRDEKMVVVFEAIRTVAKTDISALILGPTGSGKEVVARMIHELSRRGGHPFQAVNCAALPDSLFESEVFGHEKGAFTGAHDRKPGRIELANQGTLFLDEIGDLTMFAQAKLLRVLEERRVERLGSRDSLAVDFRLISATNRPLDLLVTDRRFREDLYYRVNAFTIRLPALKERPADIPVLVERFLANHCVAHGLPVDGKRFSSDALTVLTGYSWPGNIRELIATVSRAALSARGAVIEPSDISFLCPTGRSRPADTAVESLEDVERRHIVKVLQTVSWNKKQAARLLKISRETLYRKIRAYGLTPDPGAGAALGSVE